MIKVPELLQSNGGLNNRLNLAGDATTKFGTCDVTRLVTVSRVTLASDRVSQFALACGLLFLPFFLISFIFIHSRGHLARDN